MNKLLPSLIFALLIISLASCESNEKTTNDIWADTQQIQFDGENIFLKLPRYFKRSSRYFLENDFDYLQKDSVKLRKFQDLLQGMEFQDAEIDFFIDTTQQFHVLFLTNTAQVTFDKKTAELLNANLNAQYEALEAEDPNLSITKLESKLKGTKNLQMMKFKHQFQYTLHNTQHINTVIFITTPVRTIISTEVSLGKEDVEDYLWSLTER